MHGKGIPLTTFVVLASSVATTRVAQQGSRPSQASPMGGVEKLVVPMTFPCALESSGNATIGAVVQIGDLPAEVGTDTASLSMLLPPPSPSINQHLACMASDSFDNGVCMGFAQAFNEGTFNASAALSATRIDLRVEPHFDHDHIIQGDQEEPCEPPEICPTIPTFTSTVEQIEFEWVVPFNLHNYQTIVQVTSHLQRIDDIPFGDFCVLTGGSSARWEVWQDLDGDCVLTGFDLLRAQGAPMTVGLNGGVFPAPQQFTLAADRYFFRITYDEFTLAKACGDICGSNVSSMLDHLDSFGALLRVVSTAPAP